SEVCPGEAEHQVEHTEGADRPGSPAGEPFGALGLGYDLGGRGGVGVHLHLSITVTRRRLRALEPTAPRVAHVLPIDATVTRPPPDARLRPPSRPKGFGPNTLHEPAGTTPPNHISRKELGVPTMVHLALVCTVLIAAPIDTAASSTAESLKAYQAEASKVGRD